ncbi:MAG: ABC transporter substrate-binding protein [Christensenellaceae bacterium]|nr:ABC transporter substrate-binding protein [Christensenellaceae bacterium]MEA5067801.1 ABC transporter substrate-binding protein [Christensenellaceae bacterium]
MKRLGWALVALCLLLAPLGAGAAALPADGWYTVRATLTGGSGRASVASPAALTVADGVVTATVVWSSPYYEYMVVGGETYHPVQAEGNATFEIPITLDADIPVSAQTVAMSEPHLIEYTLRFDSATLEPVRAGGGLGNGWQRERSMALEYASQFSVDYYAGGYKLIRLADGSRFLTVPEGARAPDGIDADIAVLRQPIADIYLVATSAMCLFDALDALDAVGLSGTKAEGWYNENARAAMEAGDIRFAGKYSEPDYELILASGCPLAVESLMIAHAPQVREKLEDLGIPVLVDRSSLEVHPLGRTEWLKLYAALLNREDVAEALFNGQAECLNEAASKETTGKTVAFFYISSSGYAVARKSGDYVTRMIELAGGSYVFDDLGDPETAASTVTLEMEKFYATAKDADFIVYNSTIGGELKTLDELIAKNALLKDFKAVQNGNVWCTNKNLFQETTQLGRMILDINRMLENDDPALTALEYLYKLQ